MKKNNMKREALGPCELNPCGFNMQRYSHKLQDIQNIKHGRDNKYH